MSKGVKIQIETLYLKAFYLNVGKYIEIINYYLSQKNEALPLGNYIKIFGGFAFKSTGYQKEGIPIIRISDFQNEQIVLENCKRYKEDSSLEKYELKIGDIIIALTGGTIGKLAIVQEGLGRIYMNQRVGRFDILNPELFEKEYAYWIARGVQEKVKNLAWGGAQPNVSGKQIENMEFPIPEKSIQKKIIQFLNDLKNNSINDSVYFNRECEKEIIRLQNKQIALFQIKKNTNNEEGLLKILRQQILQDAISGKLTADWREKNPEIEPASKLLEKIKVEKEKLIAEKKIKKEKSLPKIAESEIPFELPDEWKWCRLGEIVYFSENNNIHSNLNENEIVNYVDIDAVNNKTFSIENIKEKKVKDLSSRARRVLSKGDIVYSLVRPYLNNIAIVQENKPNYIGSTGFAVFSGIIVINNFLFNVLLSDYIRKLYLEFLSGFNSPSITHDQFKNTAIPLPPLAEQKIIVAKIEKLTEHVSGLEEKIKQNKQNAEMLMQSFLVEAFKN